MYNNHSIKKKLLNIKRCHIYNSTIASKVQVLSTYFPPYPCLKSLSQPTDGSRYYAMASPTTFTGRPARTDAIPALSAPCVASINFY